MPLMEKSGVASGEEVEHAVNIGGVADISHFHVDIDKTVQSIHFNGKRRAIGEMVD